MVQRLIASAAVVMALWALGWVAGAELGDPFGARRPLSAVKAPVAAGCHLTPQLEQLPGKVTFGDLESSHRQESNLRSLMYGYAAELSDCAKRYGEPGAEQFARVTVSRSGAPAGVQVQGASVSEALRDCVEAKLIRRTFYGGPSEFVLILPVQDCPERDGQPR